LSRFYFFIASGAGETGFIILIYKESHTMSKNSAAFSARRKIPYKLIAYFLCIALLAPYAAACKKPGSEAGGYEYKLSNSVANRRFTPEGNNKFSLPEITSDDPGEWSYAWSYKESSIPEPVAVLLEDDDESYLIRPIDAMHGVATASTIFTAAINGSKGVVTRDFTVNVDDKGDPDFQNMYSTQDGHIDYMTQGIGKTRVFGLYDYSGPASVSPNVFQENPAFFKEGAFTKSSDSFKLGWNYRGAVSVGVWAEDMAGNRITDKDNIGPDGTVDVIYNPDVDQRAVTVKFKGACDVRIVAQSKTPYRGNTYARYEYVYAIKDAVNTYDFSDVKLMEKLARYDYITNGVKFADDDYKTEKRYVKGQDVKRVGSEAITGGALGEYIVPGSNPNGKLSAHFQTAPTPYMAEPNSGSTLANSDAYDDGAFMKEFERWAPAYKYKDIVIRSTNKDPAKASRKMYTWAEGTWFFGSVYGNGYELDATPYTRGGVAGFNSGNYAFEENGRRILEGGINEPNGTYRNVHSMRGIDDGGANASLGFEGKQFFKGYGWGDIFAFYALSNNSTIDNITLTGEDIKKDNEAIKLYQYSKIGVLGTSMMAGRDRPFSQGNAHDGGAPKEGLYIEGIKVQNSILEKGLTLFGAGFAPDASNPCVSDTNVFRFAGFTGILGSAYGGGINNEDTENGEAVADYNSLSRDSFGNDILNRQGKSFGNFITARNGIYHDISVSPLLTMPSKSGTRIEVVGNDNYFYTWLKSNEIQFPEMKNPKNEGVARVLGSSINAQVPSVMGEIFAGVPSRLRPGGNSFYGGNNDAAKYYPDIKNSPKVFLVNIPAISVVAAGQAGSTEEGKSFITNHTSFERSSLDGANTEDFARISDAISLADMMADLNQGFHVTMLKSPDADGIPAEANLIRVNEINSENINERMAAMIPAGTLNPTISRTVVNLPASEIRLMSALKGYLAGGKAITFDGCTIRYNGTVVPFISRGAEEFTISTAVLINLKDDKGNHLGINKFGRYKFDLVFVKDGKEERTPFEVLFQGGNGSNPSVTPGMEGYTAAGTNLEYEINLDAGDGIAGESRVTLQERPISYTFAGGKLQIDGNLLRDGDNTLSVVTDNGTQILLRQAVKKINMFADSWAFDTASKSDFEIDLPFGTETSTLAIAITVGGTPKTLSAGDYTLIAGDADTPHKILIGKDTLSIAGVSTVSPGSYPVTITNDHGLNIETSLTVTANRDDIGIESISVPGNSAEGIFVPFVNKAEGHIHKNKDVEITLSNYQGQNIIGISVNGELIRFGAGWGFVGTGSTRLLTIPAAAIGNSNIPAGAEYQITVVTGMDRAGMESDITQTLWVYDANHDDAAVWLRSEYEHKISDGNLTLGIEKEVPFVDKDIFNENHFDGSTFPDNIIFIIYNIAGDIVESFTREQLADILGNADLLVDRAARTNETLNEMMSRLISKLYADEITILELLESVAKILCEIVPEPMTTDEALTGLLKFVFEFSEEDEIMLEELLELVSGKTSEEIIDIVLNYIPETMMGMDIPRTGKYASGVLIPAETLNSLGVGTYTVEIRNNFNISYATLKLV